MTGSRVFTVSTPETTMHTCHATHGTSEKSRLRGIDTQLSHKQVREERKTF